MILERYQLFTQHYGLIVVIVEHAGGIWRVKHGDEYIAEALTKDEALKIAASPRFRVKQQKHSYRGAGCFSFVALDIHDSPITMTLTLKDCIKNAEKLKYKLL